jgi:hypothetical protein
MSVNQFMTGNLPAIRGIISQMNRPFDSHDFIRRFAKMFEVDYVQLLTQYQKKPFQKVHQQIGLFLADNQAALGIQQNGKISSPNIFGDNTQNEQWQ